MGQGRVPGPGKLLDTVRAALTQADPQAAGQFEKALQMAATMTGVDIEQDVIGAVGPHWIVYSNAGASGAGIFSAQVVFVNHLSDPTGAEKALTSLEQIAVGGALAGGAALEVSARVQELNGLKIHVLSSPQGALEWAVHNDSFFASITPGGLSRAINQVQATNSSILDRPKLSVLRDHIRKFNVKAVTFADLPKTVVPI